MAYKYLVTDKASGTKRLVEASSPANAIAFIAKDNFTTTRVTDNVADMINLPLEKVTGDTPAAEPEPSPEPVGLVAGKSKAPVTAE